MRLLSAIIPFLIFLSTNNSGNAGELEDCKSKDIFTAVRACSDYMRSDVYNPVAYIYRGKAWYSFGDFDKAIADFNFAIQVGHGNWEPYYNRGLTYSAKGNDEAALDDLNTAIKLDQRVSVLYDGRGKVYDNLMKFDAAIADFTKAIELEPSFASAFSNRGLTFAHVGDFDQAFSDLDKAIDLNQQDAKGYLNRGLAWSKTGKYERAVADISHALQLWDYAKDGPIKAAVTALTNVRELKKRGADQTNTPTLAASGAPFDAELLTKAIAESVHRRLGAGTKLGGLSQTPNAGPQGSQSIGNNTETRVALVIGNSNYRSVSGLPNAINDAELAGSALQRAGFIDVTIARDLDRAALVAALRSFREKAASADWAVVYYAGHGIEIGGRNYLIPIDAKLKSDLDVEDEAVALQRVLLSVDGANKIRLIAVDACRDNPFTAQMKMTGGSRSVGRGLARVEPDGATLVLFAAKEGTTAADGDGSNSPFAMAFARRIVEPGVELGLTLRRVSDDVFRATAKAQEPVQYGRLPVEELYFVPIK